MWNYVGFLSYHARQISIFTPAYEMPVLTFYPNSIPKFTSQARAKFAGVAFALHMIFSSQMIYANVAECSSLPMHKSLLGTKLNTSIMTTKAVRLLLWQRRDKHRADQACTRRCKESEFRQ